MEEYGREVPPEQETEGGSLMKKVLAGRLIAENWRKNFGFLLLLVGLGIYYIYNGYSVERLHRERTVLEREVKDLRFESITTAADLMFMCKQSEVIKRIKWEGMALEESKEPPVKIYR